MHDTVPLDEATQNRARDTVFHTGDVWKIVPCLKYYRPDLTIVTVITPPTGLTLVTGLDAASKVLAGSYEEAVERFAKVPFSSIAADVGTSLNVIMNDWNLVEAHLRERSVL